MPDHSQRLFATKEQPTHHNRNVTLKKKKVAWMTEQLSSVLLHGRHKRGAPDKGAVITDRFSQPLFQCKWEWWSEGMGAALGDCFHGVGVKYAYVCICARVHAWVVVWWMVGFIDKLPVLEKARLGRPPTLHGRFPLINPNEDMQVTQAHTCTHTKHA